MKSESYYSNSYGKPNPAKNSEIYRNQQAFDLEKRSYVPRLSSSLSDSFDEDLDSNFERRNPKNSYHKKYRDNGGDQYLDTLQEENYDNGMNMKFEIQHKKYLDDSLNDNDFKQKDGFGSKNLLNGIDSMKPSYQFVVDFLKLYSISKEQADNSRLCDEALNKYITIWQKELKKRRENKQPTVSDNAFLMHLYPGYVVLLDCKTQNIIKKQPIDKIVAWGFSKKNKDPLFAYINRDKEKATCWLFHTFQAPSAINDGFKSVCYNKMDAKNSNGQDFSNKSLQSNKKYNLKKNKTEARYFSDQDIPAKNQHNKSKYNLNESKMDARYLSDQDIPVRIQHYDNRYGLNENKIDARYSSDQDIAGTLQRSNNKYISNQISYKRPQSKDQRSSRIMTVTDEDYRSPRSSRINYSPDFSPNYADHEGRYEGRDHFNFNGNGQNLWDSFEDNDLYLRTNDRQNYQRGYQEPAYVASRRSVPAITNGTMNASNYDRRENVNFTQSYPVYNSTQKISRNHDDASYAVNKRSTPTISHDDSLYTNRKNRVSAVTSNEPVYAGSRKAMLPSITSNEPVYAGSRKQMLPSITYEENPYTNSKGRLTTHTTAEPVYATSRRSAVPAITSGTLDTSNYERRDNGYAASSNSVYNNKMSKSRTGTINGGYHQDIRIQSHPTEIITTITCQYVGFVAVNKIVGVPSANKIADSIITSMPRNKWLNVKVIITSSNITVENKAGPILKTKLTNVNYCASLDNDKRFAIISALRVDGKSMCLVFFCKPNCQHLIKSILSALQFQKRKKYRLRLCVDTLLCVHG